MLVKKRQNSLYNKLSIKKVISNYNLFYFFCILIYTAKATKFTRALEGYPGNIVAFMIPLILTIIFWIRNKIQINIQYLGSAIYLYIGWFILQFIKYGGSNLSLTFFLFYQIFIAYGIVYVFKWRLYILFEKYVTWLSLICLIVWVINLFIPIIIDVTIGILSIPIGKESLIKYNILIASVINEITNAQLSYRNPGFSWEPGMNASLLCTAIYINLFINNFKIRNNPRLIILILSLLSTFSTTGFSTFFSVICCFYILNTNNKHKYFLLLLFIPIALYIYNLDFIGNKISKLNSNHESITNIIKSIEWQKKDNETITYVPQRFDGLVLEFMNIKHDPIIGYGISTENSYANHKISEHIKISNGNLQIISKFGIIGIIIIILIFMNTLIIAKRFNYKYGWTFFILYILISTSYPFYSTPLFISIFMSHYLYKKLK